jgi:hypothetical protein
MLRTSSLLGTGRAYKVNSEQRLSKLVSTPDHLTNSHSRFVVSPHASNG